MPSPLRQQRDKERKLKTREALIESAKRNFIERGYHDVLISDIVSGAGVGQGTFYRNFQSKREVFEVLFDQIITEMLAKFDPMSTNLPTNEKEYREASKKAVTEMSEVITANREMVQMFLRIAPAIDSRFSEKIDGVYEQFARLAEFYLNHAIANGFARPCSARVVSQAIIGIALRMVALEGDNIFTEMTVDEIATELVDFSFQGFGLVAEGDPDAPAKMMVQ